MKTKLGLTIAMLAGLLAISAFGANSPAASADSASPSPSAAKPSPPRSEISTPPAPSPSPGITEAEAVKKSAVPLPRYPAHPSTSSTAGKNGAAETAQNGAGMLGSNPDFFIAAPPPVPRPETKPPAPAAGYVWVPGHYMPVKGEWQWVAGEWGVPATPSSVWIDARYDAKVKYWTPGYWQPDRPTPEPSAPTKDGKEAAPAAPGGY